MLTQIQVGAPAQKLASSANPTARGGNQGEIIASELHGRLYQTNYDGNLYAGGISTLTSISNATFTVATLGATCTPVVGLWNPTTSGVNAIVIQSAMTAIMTALQATGCGGFVWATSVGNGAISTGTTPISMLTLQASGSKCKDMSGIALTGLTTALTVKFGSQLNGGSSYNTALLATAAGFQTTNQGAREDFDGGLIVPPGGVLALLAGTTPVAHSAISRILWEEAPV